MCERVKLDDTLQFSGQITIFSPASSHALRGQAQVVLDSSDVSREETQLDSRVGPLGKIFLSLKTGKKGVPGV